MPVNTTAPVKFATKADPGVVARLLAVPCWTMRPRSIDSDAAGDAASSS
jgi:hypothetical protein